MADDLFQRTPHAPSGGGMSDMLSAFKSFGESIDQLGAQRAISQANDNVDLIRNSELDDAKKQQAMQDNARRLAGQLTGFGGSASGTQQLYNAFAPAKPAMPQNDTEAAYIFRNDPVGLKQWTAARKQILDVTDPVEEDSLDNSLKQQKFDNEKDQQNIGNLTKLRQKANDAEAAGRGPMGKLAIRRDQVNDLNGLLTSPDKYNEMARTNVQELATGMDGVFRGGVATEGGVKGLVPDGLQQSLADLRQKAESRPTAQNAGEFIKLYKETIDRTNEIVSSQLQAYKKQTLRAVPAIARKAGIDDFSAMSEALIGEKATLEGNRIKFSGDEDEAKVKNGLGALFKYPDDPNARGVLQRIEADPVFWHTMFNPENKALVNQLKSFKNRLYK